MQNIASGWHLLDAARLVGSDPRVKVAFTATPEAWRDGADRLLREMGAVLLPWREACAHEFGLAIATSSEPASRVRAPLAVLPWCGGEHAHRAPSLALLAHVADLARARPAVVVGDSSHDRLVASRALRPFYRRALGVGPRQRLLVVGVWPGPWAWGHEVLSRALRELPADQYRVLAVPQPHPYAGTGYGGLAGLLKGGLSLMPPESDWRAALVAADWIIDDHGVLATYGTVAGAPILLSEGYGAPCARLRRLAHPLSPRRPLEAQLREAAGQSPGRYGPVLARITSEPGRFNRNTRRALYRLLRLGQPPTIPTTDPVSPPFRID